MPSCSRRAILNKPRGITLTDDAFRSRGVHSPPKTLRFTNHLKEYSHACGQFRFVLLPFGILVVRHALVACVARNGPRSISPPSSGISSWIASLPGCSGLRLASGEKRPARGAVLRSILLLRGPVSPSSRDGCLLHLTVKDPSASASRSCIRPGQHCACRRGISWPFFAFFF